MRQLRLLALLAPALLLPVACEDSSSAPATPFTFEAGPGFEAGPPAEAGPLEDAGVDAADTAPPAPKGVTVTVIDGLAPKADVRVISQDATGAVIGDAKTDATGKLTIATPPSIVTVLATRNSAPTPVSFYAVAEGDNLVVRIPPAVITEQAPISHYSVTFTGPAGSTVNANVSVNDGCFGNTTDVTSPILVDLYPNCISAANAFLADGVDVEGLHTGFAFKKGVAAPAANATDNVVLGAWTAPGQITLDAVNRPSGALSLAGDLYMIAGTSGFHVNGFGSLDDGGLKFTVATGFSDAYQSFVRAQDDVSGADVETAFIRREAVPAAATLPTFDFANALPFITATAIDVTTPARPNVTLTSGSVAAADGGAVVLTWTTATSFIGNWTFVLPASAVTSFKAPALPADAIAFAPTASVTIDSALVFEATQLPGYKETKQLPITPSFRPDFVSGSVPLPANGTVRVSTWAPSLPSR